MTEIERGPRRAQGGHGGWVGSRDSRLPGDAREGDWQGRPIPRVVHVTRFTSLKRRVAGELADDLAAETFVQAFGSPVDLRSTPPGAGGSPPPVDATVA